jgi:cell division protein YceG involved in septum cleavage
LINLNNVTFYVSVTVTVNIAVCWDVTSYNLTPDLLHSSVTEKQVQEGHVPETVGRSLLRYGVILHNGMSQLTAVVKFKADHNVKGNYRTNVNKIKITH